MSPDFYEFWGSVICVCLFTEVKQQWAMLVLGWVTASSCVSDGFAARASTLKPLSALLSQIGCL